MDERKEHLTDWWLGMDSFERLIARGYDGLHWTATDAIIKIRFEKDTCVLICAHCEYYARFKDFDFTDMDFDKLPDNFWSRALVDRLENYRNVSKDFYNEENAMWLKLGTGGDFFGCLADGESIRDCEDTIDGEYEHFEAECNGKYLRYSKIGSRTVRVISCFDCDTVYIENMSNQFIKLSIFNRGFEVAAKFVLKVEKHKCLDGTAGEPLEEIKGRVSASEDLERFDNSCMSLYVLVNKIDAKMHELAAKEARFKNLQNLDNPVIEIDKSFNLQCVRYGNVEVLPDCIVCVEEVLKTYNSWEEFFNM